MKIENFYKGQKFDVYYIVQDDRSCPFINFFEKLQRDDVAAHKSIINVIKRHADSGPILNEKKSKAIEGYDDLYEFKSPQGARLLYFYLRGSKTIITHGFKKGVPVKEEYKRAINMRDKYLQEVTNDRM